MDVEEAIETRVQKFRGGSKTIRFVIRRVGPLVERRKIQLARKRVKIRGKETYDGIDGATLLRKFEELGDPVGKDFYSAAAILVEASLGSIPEAHIRGMERALEPARRRYGFDPHTTSDYNRAGLRQPARGGKLKRYLEMAKEAYSLRDPEFLRRRYRLLSLGNLITAEMRSRGKRHCPKIDKD
ncbi:MAG: hypothetical protein ABIG96_02625 [Candidatus Micrarchaeota archaeon]